MPALFLDRDGVINVRTVGDYVKSPAEFVPVEGLGEAMRLLAGLFERIVVVTNQAGIGRGRMAESDLIAVHTKMIDIVQAAGGRIDKAYYCPHRSDAGCDCRKPAPGMAHKAKTDFPDIDFKDAWLIGDSASDIEFGQRLGMHTALITGKTEETEILNNMEVDIRCGSLLEFVKIFNSRK